TAISEFALKRIGVGDLLLDEMRIKLVDRTVQSRVRDDPALVKRIFIRMLQRDELVVVLNLWKLKSRHPAHCLLRNVSSSSELFPNSGELVFSRHTIKTTNACVYRMNLAPTDERDQFIADLLQLQSS